MIVRKATVFDAEALWCMWAALHEHEAALCGGRHPSALPTVQAETKEQWAARFSFVVASPSCLLLVACEKKLDKPVGYMLSSVGQRDIGTPGPFLQVHELYVDPAYRGSSDDRAAAQLELATATWAKEHGLTTAVITCVPAEKQVQRWLRKGFRQTLVTLEREI